MSRTTVSTILVMISFLCCTSTQTVADTDLPSISFGAGGGFVGEMTQYVLRENRELYSVDMEVDSLVSIGRVRKSTCRDMFKRLDLLHDEEINAPGNRWYFVELKNGSDSTRLLWGDQAVDVPTGLIELWDDLMELTQPK